MKRAEFIDWKRHPVTQVVLGQLESRIQEMQEILGASAGINPMQDREFVGAIKAYKDMVTIDFDEEESQ
jgi:hypothetical protein